MAKPQIDSLLSTFLTTCLTFGCAIFTGALVAKLLHPEGRGILAQILFWPELLAALGICGLPEAVVCQFSQHNTHRNTAKTAAVCALSLALVATIGAFFLIPLFLDNHSSLRSSTAFLYTLCFVPLHYVATTLMAVDQGNLDFNRYNLSRLTMPLVYAASLFILWSIDNIQVETVLSANILGLLASAALRLWLSRSHFGGTVSFTEARALLTRGLRFHATTLLVLLAARIDRAIVFSLWDNSTAGLYAVALTYSGSALGIITSTVQIIVLPKMARHDKSAEQHYFLGRTIRASMLTIILCSMPLILAAPWLVPNVFGQDFRSAIVPCIILIIAYAPLALRQIITRAICGMGDGRLGVIAESAAIVSFVLFGIPLGRTYGLSGICCALLLSNLFALALTSNYLRTTTGITIQDQSGFTMATLREIRQYATESFIRSSASSIT